MPSRRGGAPKLIAEPSRWFCVAEIEPGVVLVGEPGYVYSWLVVGRDDSLLLDSGLGVADIRAAIADVADDPLLVNSHAHFDHVGGNAHFSRRAIHPLGTKWLARMDAPDAPWEYRLLDFGDEATREYAAAAYENWRELRDLDRRFHFALGPEQEVRAWPRAEPGTFAPKPPPPTQLVEEGHVLDLGSRRLRVLHTPGHAPEHICLLDERDGILFAQDQAYYGRHYICFGDSDLEAWVASATRLADELVGSIRIVYTAHSLRWSAPPSLLRELAEAGERVLDGRADVDATVGPSGGPARAADFGHFSLVLPQGEP